MCVSNLARYIEFLWEEEERLVEHAKSLTATVTTAHANAEARDQEIYDQSGRFERDRLERQWAFELASSLNVQQRQAPCCICPARR